MQRTGFCVKELAKQLRVELKCNICGSQNLLDLVRDHNHFTGFIRGILCDKCNCYLGTYESKVPFHRNPSKRKKEYREWVWKFQKEIEAHLKTVTNIPFTGYRRFLKSFRRRPVGIKVIPVTGGQVTDEVRTI